MKKIILVIAAVAMATMAEAAAFKWQGTANQNGVALGALDGDGTYAAGGSSMKGNSTLAYVLNIYDASDALLGSASGNVAWAATGPKFNVSGTVADIDAWTVGSANYKYEIILTGTQSDMIAYTDAKWDYSDATVSATLTGTFDGKTGAASIKTGAVSNWTVAGAVAVPEPTSGLLLLLGMAGLALRRKQA